jgi:hypothetical protein
MPAVANTGYQSQSQSEHESVSEPDPESGGPSHAVVLEIAGQQANEEAGQEAGSPGPGAEGDDGWVQGEMRSLDMVEQDLSEVEDALGRLEDGTYGRCVACDVQLTDEELEAKPTARFCPLHGVSDLELRSPPTSIG